MLEKMARTRALLRQQQQELCQAIAHGSSASCPEGSDWSWDGRGPSCVSRLMRAMQATAAALARQQVRLRAGVTGRVAWGGGGEGEREGGRWRRRCLSSSEQQADMLAPQARLKQTPLPPRTFQTNTPAPYHTPNK